MKRLVLLLCLVACAPAHAAKPAANVVVKADLDQARWQRLANKSPVWPSQQTIHVLYVHNCPGATVPEAAGCYVGDGWIYLVKAYRTDWNGYFLHELGHAYEDMVLGNIEYSHEGGLFRWLMPEAWAAGGALYAHEWFAEMYEACTAHTKPIQGNIPNNYGFTLRPRKERAFCYWLALRGAHLYP